MREIFKNDSSTTLAEDIDSSQTSFDVADGSVFPATGDFRLRVGAELMLCTARSGDTLTVVRDAEDLTAESHSTGAAVVHVATAGGMVRWGRDSVPFFDTDTPPLHRLAKDDGSLLVASDFTWQNQGSSSLTDKHGSILGTFLSETGSPANYRRLLLTAPSPPYTYIMAFHGLFTGATGGHDFVGPLFRDTVSARDEVLGLFVSNTAAIATAQATADTGNVGTMTAHQGLYGFGPVLWFKISDDSTNLIWSISPDGVNWSQVQSRGRTAHLTNGPNRVGWIAQSRHPTTYQTHVRLLHWSRES